jgi:abhydrolase domain-containing protein 17
MKKNKIKKLVLGNFSIKRLIRSVLAILLILYVFLLFIGFFCADKLIFPVPKPSYRDTAETRKLTLPDGKKITIYEISVINPDFYIIYSHGNAVDLGLIKPSLKRMATNIQHNCINNRNIKLENYARNAQKDIPNKNALVHNCSVIGYDYPGYGTSDGKPSEKSITESIEAVYKYLKDKGATDKQIVIWGRSVGSGPATYIVYKYPVAGLILESAFTSAFRVVTRIQIVPFDRFPNINRIARVNCPVLFIHGRMDRVIPFHHGETLYNEAKAPKYYLWVDDAGHNNIEWTAGEEYWTSISNFLETLKKR